MKVWRLTKAAQSQTIRLLIHSLANNNELFDDRVTISNTITNRYLAGYKLLA